MAPVNEKLNDALSKYLDQLKVSYVNEPKAIIEEVVRDIIHRVELKDPRFQMGLEFRGSMYEKAKIKEANEFDFDLPIKNLTVDEAPRKKLSNSISMEYTTYTLDPSLQEKWSNLADKDNKLLSAERVIQAFSNLVGQVIDDLNKEEKHKFIFDFKTNHPAVTVIFKQYGTAVYDVDLAPVIEVRKWPDTLTRGWQNRSRKGWPSEDLIKTIMQTSVYLVPKLYKGKDFDGRDFLWRFAFNKAEKKLLLASDTKVENCCRRPVLRILKGLLSDLDWTGLRSYHMKTIMLHECETWPNSDDWKREDLGERVLSAVRRLNGCLSIGKGRRIKHYFVPGVNILDGMNEQQKDQILAKQEAFFFNPLAFMMKLTEGGGKVAAGDSDRVDEKKKSESCQAYVKLLKDLLSEVKAIAEMESPKILEICKKYEKGHFKQLGI